MKLLLMIAPVLLVCISVFLSARVALEYINSPFMQTSKVNILASKLDKLAYSKMNLKLSSISSVHTYLRRVSILFPSSVSLESICVIYLLLSCILFVIIGLVAQELVFLFICLLLVYVGSYIFAIRKYKAKEQVAIMCMPEILRSLANSLSSGHSVQQALEYVGEKSSGSIGEAFASCAYKIKTGTSTSQALQELEHELALPGIRLLSISLDISQQTGSGLQALFEKASESIEDSSGLERELQVKTSQAKLSAKIIVALPLLLLLMISLISPDFRAGIATPIGLSCLILGLLLDGLGLFLIHHILQVEVHS